ncbi:MAG: ATPase, partial [Acidobacteria bacterium]|nr:ATPase [Acidobacteriota bacterium]
MTRHVVFVGPDVFDVYQEFARGLKEVGARVTGIGHTPPQRLPPALGQWLDGYHRITSLLDAAEILEAVRSIDRERSVELVETADESLVLATAEAREALSLPGISAHTARLCRDKTAMKEALRQAGVPCARSTAVSSAEEALRFAEEVGYPLVLKPRAGLGALHTYRANDHTELEEAVRRLEVSAERPAALEEYIEGHEGFWDTLTVDGEVQHEFISHYYPTVLAAMQDRSIAPQIAVTNRIDAPGYDELKTMGRKVLA